MATGTTKLENMVNPEVMAPMVSAKLEAAMKFAPLATIDRTLQGKPGGSIYAADIEDIRTRLDSLWDGMDKLIRGFANIS